MKQTTLVQPSDLLAEIVKDIGENWCVPVTVEPVKKYALNITSTHETRRGISWVGMIYSDGKKVIEVSNDGHGGSNHYSMPASGTENLFHVYLDQLVCDADECYGNDDCENHDKLVSFLDLIANGL